MARIPNLDWPLDLFSEAMDDQLMIERRENGFWEQGDCLACFGGQTSLASGIAEKPTPPLLLLVATLDNTEPFRGWMPLSKRAMN